MKLITNMNKKPKRNKAFIFTISAIYTLLIFLFFLGVYNSNEDNNKILNSYKIESYNHLIDFINSEPTSADPLDKGWCSTYFIYDANSSDLDSQSNLIIKKYCDNYAR